MLSIRVDPTIPPGTSSAIVGRSEVLFLFVHRISHLRIHLEYGWQSNIQSAF
jgi:hypothetical protein